MKQATIKKYTEILLATKNSGKSLKTFCINNGLNYKSIINTISALKKQNDNETDDIRNLLQLYSEVTTKKVEIAETIETDDRADTSIIRGEDGKIKYYSYQIFRRDKAPLSGKLTREEMNTIYRLYSYYGDALTQRMISRHFVDLSLVDFKRILRAFNITKASAPFAPHMFEELSEKELRAIQLREKENSFLRKAEEDQIRNAEKLLKKYAQENLDLKAKLKDSQFTVNVNSIAPINIENNINNNRIVNLYLADMHIGAAMETSPLYSENVNYGKEEIIRRLTSILLNLASLGKFGQINLVLLGDNVDCCGIAGRTSRLDHEMPENMTPREQANTFIDIMMWFVESLMKFESKLHIYSVPCGNHAGNFEYVCNKALLNGISATFKGVETTLWEEYYGMFEVNKAKFIVCHGNIK